MGDESIFTFTRDCADFRDPTAVFRFMNQRAINQVGERTLLEAGCWLVEILLSRLPFREVGRTCSQAYTVPTNFL